jgi:triosephosphate isomerase
MIRDRRPLVAGNWKMHHGGTSGVELAADIVRLAHDVPHVDIVIAPPYTALAACAHECDGSRIEVAAQNCYPKDAGAYTGEVSPRMLVDAGCTWVILGHSERRQHFGESDAFVAQKVAAALAAGLSPIVCILYGGSVKPDNARELLAATDVDGALVGGASLDAETFGAIVRAAEALAAR